MDCHVTALASHTWRGPSIAVPASSPLGNLTACPAVEDESPTHNQTRESTPTKVAPARVAKKAAPKSLEVPPANTSDSEIVKHEEAKPATAVKADPSPVPNRTPGSEVGTTPEQIATAPTEENLTTATASPSPEKPAESDTEPSTPSAAVPPADAETTALAQPNNADQLVAILLVRLEIKSVSDLANKVVAIDVSPSDSVAGVRSAIVAAGANEVQMSEDQTLALVRLIDGEVPAAVVAVVSPTAADVWNAGLSGFNVLRLPLPSPSKAKPG